MPPRFLLTRGAMRLIAIGFLLFFCSLLRADETECIEYASVRKIKNTRYTEQCKIDIKALLVVCRNEKNRLYSVTEFGSLSDLARSYRDKINLSRRLLAYSRGLLLWSVENFFDAQKRAFKVIQKFPPDQRIYEFTAWDIQGRPLRGIGDKNARCPREVIYHYDDKNGETTLWEKQSNPQCPPQRLLLTYRVAANDLISTKMEVDGEMRIFDKFEVVAREKVCFPKP